MSVTRAVVLVAGAAFLAAAILAVASRAPESLRTAVPGPGATDPSLGDRFTAEQIARAGAYRGPAYLALALSTALHLLVLIVLLRGPFARLVDATAGAPGGWVLQAVLLGACVAVLVALVGLPLGFVRGFAMERAWGLSTQDVGGWLSDRAKSLAVGAAVAGVASFAFFAVVRWQPRLWWLWGWAAFSVLSAALVFVWPVLVAPLFNRFTPLHDEELARRAVTLAERAGVTVDRVLVADASRRTTAENAYVAGLGATKRLVLYDTLLEGGGERETLFVVGHELGHQAENHVLKGVAMSWLGLLVGFAVLAWLAAKQGFLDLAGASSIGDLRVIPLLLLFAAIASLVAAPVEAAVSRSHEARADAIAVGLTDDAGTAVETFRRLALTNLADLRPPRPAVWLLFTHPPIPERIRAVTSGRDAGP
jgi:STE24 endopeptidase